MKTVMPVAESPAALESAVRAVGEELFNRMEAHPSPGILSRKGAYARIMEWSMKDPAFKAQLFRFVDVLPSLDSASEVVRHLREYLGDKAVELNPAMKTGLAAAAFAPSLVAGPVRANVAAMAGQFVAGATPAELVKRLQRNAASGIATTIDLLGETVVSHAEADHFLERNLKILDAASEAVRGGKPSASDLGPNGPLPRVNLSVKVSALTPEVHPADPESSIAALKERLRPILRRAKEHGAFVNFDMESHGLKDLTFSLFRSILEEPEFVQGPSAGIAVQAYLRDCEKDLLELIGWARSRGRPIVVRLVKGAYWDYETILAGQRGWPVPVWSEKAESDASYERLSLLLLENTDIVSPAFASHNVRSCAHAIAQARRLGVDPRAFEFQALYGMADELKAALVESGHRVREYCPVGELLPGMAYLVRRLLENTSNEGFLRAKDAGEASREALLRSPADILRARPPQQAAPAVRAFRNAPNTDFSVAGNRARMRSALEKCARSLGQRHPIVIGGKRISERPLVDSTNPARPSQVVGRWARATVADADAAVATARAAWPAWAARSFEERAAVLDRTADLLEERRFDLCALEVFEAAKPWIEADADISEAVDFCRFYASEARRLGRGRVTQPVPGESDFQLWTPRGVGVAIAPWNFPLAILCGMTVAPLVAGNAVIMKPAEQTTVVAASLMEILSQAGVPAGVVNFVPGFGEDVGARLVEHPDIDFIAFTGSRSVGCRIWEAAGRTRPGQRNLKKVVCEMGGKNALIIDTDADLDEAIPAALYSAFGYSGQKCSALSRLIVLDGVHDRFVERFSAACSSLAVGDPARPGTVVGPVIDAESRERIVSTIEKAKAKARLAFQAALPAGLDADGHYVPPTVFTDVAPDSPIAREEIFGPVVAILRARDLDHAFEIAMDVDYALTGGLFSRSPSALERAKREYRVGNLYLNRGITGAIVERHPFGGFLMSGGGTKAGGAGYLENFLFPRAVSENVMRRGFTPPEDASAQSDV